MAKCYDKAFKYTPVAAQGENYLQKKFAAIRRAQSKNQAEVRAKVTALPKVKVAK